MSEFKRTRYDINLTPGGLKRLEISFDPEFKSFSAVGVLPGVGGQIRSELLKDYKAAWSVRYSDLWHFVLIWKEYHLNNLHPGTPAQEAALKKEYGSNWDFTRDSDYLLSIGLLVDNGYQYGSGWTGREIPVEVQDWVKWFVESYATISYPSY